MYLYTRILPMKCVKAVIPSMFRDPFLEKSYSICQFWKFQELKNREMRKYYRYRMNKNIQTSGNPIEAKADDIKSLEGSKRGKQIQIT